MEGKNKGTSWKAEDWYSQMTEQLGGHGIQSTGGETSMRRGQVISPETGGKERQEWKQSKKER